jgi:hypothetical protein
VNLEVLSIAGGGMTDADLSGFGPLSKLDRLYMPDNEITAAEVPALLRLRRFYSLNTNHSSLDDTSLGLLKGLPELQLLLCLGRGDYRRGSGPREGHDRAEVPESIADEGDPGQGRRTEA